MSATSEVSMSEHRIADNMEVSLHFRLRQEDGT